MLAEKSIETLENVSTNKDDIIHISEEDITNSNSKNISKNKKGKKKRKCEVPPDYKCRLCGKQFISKASYFGHSAVHVKKTTERKQGFSFVF